jgi:hypothetical protein
LQGEEISCWTGVSDVAYIIRHRYATRNVLAPYCGFVEVTGSDSYCSYFYSDHKAVKRNHILEKIVGVHSSTNIVE